MKLGVFSISLSVKNIVKSKQFYENLGFTVFAGSLKENYLIMKNERSIIGLFQGMFENNIITFNPGWDENAKFVKDYDDVRTIQEHLKEIGINLEAEIDKSNKKGPGCISVIDPDGNAILIDQHI